MALRWEYIKNADGTPSGNSLAERPRRGVTGGSKMKNFVKISKVRKNLRNGSELMKDGMDKVTGGIADVLGPISAVKQCPYLTMKYQCPYINVEYSCPWNNQCNPVILYSAPGCTQYDQQHDNSEL